MLITVSIFRILLYREMALAHKAVFRSSIR